METMHRKSLFGEFSVLGMFLLVAIAGMAYGAFVLGRSILAPQAPTAPVTVAVAPTQEGYRSATRTIMRRFFVRANTEEVTLLLADASFVQELTSSLDALLGLRVPREDMQAHLEAAMLLGKWKNAAQGSGDAARLAEATATFLVNYPWAQGE